MMDWLRQTPDTLRKLADLIDGGSGMGPPKKGDGPPLPPDEELGEWFKEFDRTNVSTAGGGTVPPVWDRLVPKYRKSTFLDPIPKITKKRYVWDREQGEIASHQAAEEYADIVYAGMTDYVMEEFDDRLIRKEFDIEFFKTEIEEVDDKTPYTFFLCDESGSMSGVRAQHACALAQVAAEKVFAKGGVFVWMPYGSKRRPVSEFRDIETFISFLRKELFNCGTTYIGDNLKQLSGALNFGAAYNFDDGKYFVPKECSKKTSKVFVVHDGEDNVEDVGIQLPVFSILLANHHETLQHLSKKTRGKYLLIERPD